MNVERFKSELSELLQRFMPSNSDKNSSPAAGRLTKSQVIEAIGEIFSSELDTNLVVSTSDQNTTPASAIVVTTPDAPDIPLLNAKHNGENVRRIIRSTETGSSACEADKDVVNVIAIDVPDAHVTDKKIMSKSNPEVNKFVRSDTFVHENSSKCAENGVWQKKLGVLETKVEDGEYSTQDLTEIMKKLKVLRDSATDVVRKIDAINKNQPANSQPIRRLSLIGCPASGFHRKSMDARSIQRPKMMRRSMLATLPVTPTSSRLSPEDPKVKDAPKTRNNNAPSIPATKVDGSKLSIPPTTRSHSSGALALSRKCLTRYDSPNHGSKTSDNNTHERNNNTTSIPETKVKGSKLSIPPTTRALSSGALTLSRKSVTCYDSQHGQQGSRVTGNTAC